MALVNCIVSYCRRFVCDRVCATHRISGRTVALAGHRVTHPSIHTEAGLQATVTIVTICTGFITVQPRPPRLTGTLPLQRVTAVTSTTQSKHMMTYGKIAEASHFLLSKQHLVNRLISWLIELIESLFSSPESVLWVAEAAVFAVHAVGSIGTHPVITARTLKPRLTQTPTVDVIAAGSISTVTHTLTVLAVRTHCTLLVTPSQYTLSEQITEPCSNN